jgi:hypothetical protein
MTRDEVAAKLINALPFLPSAPLSGEWLERIVDAVYKIVSEVESKK